MNMNKIKENLYTILLVLFMTVPYAIFLYALLTNIK